MKMSLRTLIVLFSIAWLSVVLLTSALVLRYLYRDHIVSHFDGHVFAHVEELVGALRTSRDGNVELAWRPTDPNFHRQASGWYWEVRAAGATVLKSRSLGERNLDLQGVRTGQHHQVQHIPGPYKLDLNLRAQFLETDLSGIDDRLLLIVTAPETPINSDVQEYFKHIIISFLAIGAVVVLAISSVVKRALKPLQDVEKHIVDVQAGKLVRLPENFPPEIQPIANAVNSVLDRDERLFQKARKQLGDLAHAVKNPLTVIRNEARHMSTAQGQLILEQAHLMISSIDYYLSTARLYGQNSSSVRTSIQPIIKDLSYVLEHVYLDRNLDIQLLELEGHWFRGEAQDLEEVMGNLLDNACKWATHQVKVTASLESDRLVLTVEDDGPGVPESKFQRVMERGLKLDESRPGSGQGLGIVKDIVDLYDGKLTLGKSGLGGLQVKLDLPAG